MNRRSPNRRILAPVALAALAATWCPAHGQEPDLLSADQAFVITARVEARGRIAVDFAIAPGYILYRDRFAFGADAPAIRLARSTFPGPSVKFDAILNQRIQYYRDHVTVRLDLAGKPQPFRLKVQAQGCAVAAGVCYPPIEKEFQVPAWQPEGAKS